MPTHDEENNPIPGPIWHRMEGEPDDDYAMFITYRDMPKRSMRKLVAIVGMSLKTIERRALDWDWKARNQAWDDQVERGREEARIAAQAEESAKWERRRQGDAEGNYQLAEQLRSLVVKLLKHPTTRKKVREKYADGREKVTIIEPAKWTVASLARGAKLVQELGKQARIDAMDDELDGFDPETATAEECQAVLRLHSAKRKARRDAMIPIVDDDPDYGNNL